MALGPFTDSKGTYVTVAQGDTLGHIAERHYGGYSKYGALATANGISNPNRIYIGQKIYITGGSSSSSSSASSNQNKVSNVKLGALASDEKTLYASWAWDKQKQTEKYRLKWTYVTENGLTFTSLSDVSVDQDYPDASRMATFSIPANAEKISVQILPVSLEYSTVTTKIVNNLVETTTSTKKPPETKSETVNTTVKTTYWTAVWSDEKTFYTNTLPPEAFEAPTVELDGLTLKAKYENVNLSDTTATHVEFRVVQNDSVIVNTGTKLALTKLSDSNYAKVSFSCTVTPGAEYKVACRAWVGSLYSDWSPYSENVKTKPNAPAGFDICRPSSKTSIYLKWTAVPAAETYDIEYATEKDNFDLNSDVQMVTVEDKTEWELTGLETGSEYFLRIRACNGSEDTNMSAWSEIVSTIIGTKPSAPTTWSSTAKGIVGEPITLYWVHNSKDGSWQTKANLDIIVDGFTDMYELDGPGRYAIAANGTLTLLESFTEDEDKFNTCSCVIDTTGSRYEEGIKMEWRMQTAGVTGEWGEWSTLREIDIHAQPTFTNFTISAVDGVLSSFPLTINGLVGPSTQTPLGFHVSIIARDTYDTVDNLGNDKTVSAGDEIFSRYYDSFNPFPITLTPSDVDFASSVNYTLICTASMDSGLTAKATVEFSVLWSEEAYLPNAEISVNTDTYIATVKPFCKTTTRKLHPLMSVDSKLVVDTNEDHVIDESELKGVYTVTGESVLYGIDSKGLPIYHCIRYVDENYNPIDPIRCKVAYENNVYVTTSEVVDISSIKSEVTTTGEEVLLGNYNNIDTFYVIRETEHLVENIKLSVYRREFDGSFTEIETGIDNLANTAVTDPHPALDYARYRIVAVDQRTGAIGYYDPPGHPVGCKAIILQWDEAWTDFNTTNEDDKKRPLWSGSLLEFRYNVDVDNQHKKEVSMVSYIGRSHPVSYYGTHLGETSKWTASIDKADVETIYALRRLSKWMGNVYVREPSGVGYWATLSVTFPITHLARTIQVSFDITRVEGGV